MVSSVEQNIQAAAQLEEAARKERSKAEERGEAVARFAGSSTFIFLNAAVFLIWIILNTGLVHSIRPFDPYPFTFLTLVVSLEAIFLSSFVLLSQNRMNREADARARLELQINLLAEQESTKTLEFLAKICDCLGIDVADDLAAQDLARTVSVEKLAKKLKDDPGPS